MRPVRRPYLDWLRGVAVICMIEWHVLESWTTFDARRGTLWAVFYAIGGMAAPLFLFLAGLAVPFAIASHESRGQATRMAAWLVQKRGWQVFLIAHLFRLQLFLTNPNALWSSLLKPDILNILGLGLAGTAWLSGRSRLVRNDERPSVVRLLCWLVLPAVIVVALTPWSRVWWWPTLLFVRFEAYIRPVGRYGVFSLFPYVAFVPAGAFVGSLLVMARDEIGERRLQWRLAAGGLALVVVGFALGISEPALPPPIAWSLGPWPIFLIQVGYMTAAVWLSWLLMKTRMARATSGPLILFGQTSLFVYWVHVELVFGLLSYPLQGALSLPWSLAGFVLVTIAMCFAARWWKEFRSSIFELRSSISPRRSSS